MTKEEKEEIEILKNNLFKSLCLSVMPNKCEKCERTPGSTILMSNNIRFCNKCLNVVKLKKEINLCLTCGKKITKINILNKYICAKCYYKN